ncbi:MAG: RsmB/NOP family class I SAM-dependent RNA methyltransferase [Rhodospirillaceae bacterium]|nr:RsmB/NOP family class I SAM-dependent RNA methyltransferase [Rhodospirillaceae bacterium]
MARQTSGSGSNEQKKKIFLGRISKIFSLSTARAEKIVSIKLKSSVRINRLSPMPAEEIISTMQSIGCELDPISWCADAYFLKNGKGALVASKLFSEGHVYIQNASSLIPALVMEPQSGEKILDVCAAPGGKTAHMAAIAKGNGCHVDIWANDALRVKKLEDVLTTFHVPNVHLSAHQGQFIDREIDIKFDRILLDAQCSGEGMYNLSRSDALKHWSVERIQKMAYLQQKMLSAAWKVLKPGGVLVYSTCTFGPEENEGPISRHLKHNADAAIVKIDLDISGRMPGLKSWDGVKFNSDMEHAIRIMPSEYMEGFFVCRLRKNF